MRFGHTGCWTTPDSARNSMTKSMSRVFFSACLGTVFGFSTLAQTNPPPKNRPAPTPREESKEGTPPERSQEPPQQEETPSLAPVLWVTSVEVMRSTHEPSLDVIRARGVTGTEGWESAELVPLTKGTPPDGMLDLAFIAQPPSNSTTPSKSPVIEAVFTIEPGHPFKGVRVHGATNRVTLKSIPGFAEGPPPPADCTDCVGKYFVGKGESAPAGASAGDVVREETLPKTVHVVRATDGIGKLESDP